MKYSLLIVSMLLAALFCSGQSRRYVYDNAGRLTKLILSDGSAIEYSYDANGNRIKVSAISPCTDRPVPKITPADSVKICAGDSAQLRSDSAASYRWSTGATTRTISVKQAGVYKVVVSGQSGCSDSISVTVVVKPLPEITITASQSILCAGRSDTLIATGATTYLWRGPNIADSTSATTVVVPPIGKSTYYVRGMLAGCMASKTIDVTAVELPLNIAPQAQKSTLCANDSTTIQIAKSQTGIQYQLRLNNGNISVGNAVPGTGEAILLPTSKLANTTVFNVLATVTGSSCSKQMSETVTVTVIPKPTISAAAFPSVTCVGGLVALSATGATSYTWRGDGLISQTGTQITARPTATGNGTYVVIGTVSGCIDSATVTITVNAGPAISSQPLASQTVCRQGKPAPLTVVMTDNVVFSYQWYANTLNAITGGTVIPTETKSTFTPSANTIGTTYYYCVITRTNATCPIAFSQIAAVTVRPDPTFSVQPIASQSVCTFAKPDTLKVQVSGGSGTLTYQWYSNAARNTTNGSAIVGEMSNAYVPSTVVNGTLYYYCIVSQSGQGCADIVSAISSVTVSGAVTPEIRIALTCNGAAASFKSDILHGGSNPQYQWQIKNIGSPTWRDTVGATTPLLSIQQIQNGTQVRCKLISNAACASPLTVYSDSIIVNCIATAIPVIDGMDKFIIAPNPNNGIFTVQMKFNAMKTVSFKVLNALSQTLQTIPPKRIAGSYTQTIRMAHPIAGIYYLVTTIDKKTFVEKIIVE
jgi:YD repeat-containing protein